MAEDTDMETPAPTSTLELSIPAPRRHKWRLRLRHRNFERLRVVGRGERVTVGSGDEATVTLADPTVSAVHCCLQATDGGLRITDLESKNGLFVGGSRVGSATITGSTGSFSLGETTAFVEDANGEANEDDLGMVGESRAMHQVRERVRRFACLQAPVLVLGESGTGKDLVARALHRESEREGVYLPLNVAALTDALVDTELFGHTRGAFTGALADRPGAFRLADGGTLFLDEIAELSAGAQAKLLRVVEDGAVRAVGADRTKTVKTRLVSATCAPLMQRVEQERFREDLYHRISTLVIDVPPLRQRRTDIPLLIDAYLHRIEGEMGRKELSPAAVESLCRAAWPGNVRQLFSCLYRAAAVCGSGTIGPGDLDVPSVTGAGRPRLVPDKAYELLDIHGNVSAAARAAGVPRSTFRSVIARDQSKPSRTRPDM